MLQSYKYAVHIDCNFTHISFNCNLTLNEIDRIIYNIDLNITSKKDKDLQQIRVREMAEVFTPSWICNAQNNLIDNAWFKRENVFNTKIVLENGTKTWIVNEDKITYPEGKQIEKIDNLIIYI